MRRARRVAVAVGGLVALGAAACELATNFDRSKIADDTSDSSTPSDGGSTRTDAGELGDGSPVAPVCSGIVCSGVCVPSLVEGGIVDPHNCGACGRDCLGSSCQDGVCQPIRWPVDIVGQSFALDAQHIYYVMPQEGQPYGYVVQLDKNDGGETGSFVIYPFPGWMVVDSTSAYLSRGGKVDRLMLDDGGQSTLALTAQTGEIVVDGTRVYFADVAEGGISSVALDGGAGTTLAAGFASPHALAQDDTILFFATFVGIFYVAKDGSGSPQKLTNLPDCGALAVDQDYVYATTPSSVVKIARQGAATTTLLAGISTPIGLAKDERALYFRSTDGGALMRVGLDGGAPLVFLPTTEGNTPVLVDDAWVYWEGHAVYKVAKP